MRYCFNAADTRIFRFQTALPTIMTETNAVAISNSLETAHGPNGDSACAAGERSFLRDHEAMLRDVGLRPTRQRVALAKLLYTHSDRHVTAEILYAEATRHNLPVSLATIYNTLNQFAKLGLLREVGVDGSITYFDTNTSNHHHFFIDGENEIRDIPTTDILIGKMAEIPDGYEIARVDLMIRLKRKR
jgi:Fur family transcriptional regulator, iron response regulator